MIVFEKEKENMALCPALGIDAGRKKAILEHISSCLDWQGYTAYEDFCNLASELNTPEEVAFAFYMYGRIQKINTLTL